MGSALRWLLLPRGDTPFDALKHYMSVIVGVVGLLALLWAGKQIYNPPIVITVADLPKPIGEEYWLNTQIARTLIDQIERMRTIVKGERDPNFETVLNPPNIVVKSGTGRSMCKSRSWCRWVLSSAAAMGRCILR